MGCHHEQPHTPGLPVLPAPSAHFLRLLMPGSLLSPPAAVEQLRVHVRRHKGVRKFECTECGYKFTRQVGLGPASLLLPFTW